MFNFTSYIHTLTLANKRARINNFHPCTCAGIQQIQGVIDGMTDYDAFVMVNDSSAGETRRVGGAFDDINSNVVFIVKQYEIGDEEDRRRQKALCTQIMHEFESKILQDYPKFREQNVSFIIDSFMHNDLSDFIADGCTGVFFQVHIVEPIDLCYDPEEWEAEP